MLKHDITLMSHTGYTIRKEKKMYESNGFNFGVPKEIEFESMWCEKCNLECKTRCHIDGTAFQGLCEKCGMEFFVKNKWG